MRSRRRPSGRAQCFSSTRRWRCRLRPLLVLAEVDADARALQHVDAGEPRAGLGREHAPHDRAQRLGQRLMSGARSTAAMMIGARRDGAATLRRCGGGTAAPSAASAPPTVSEAVALARSARSVSTHLRPGCAARRRAARRSRARWSGSTSRQRRMISCSQGGTVG